MCHSAQPKIKTSTTQDAMIQVRQVLGGGPEFEGARTGSEEAGVDKEISL
jgi:hypothetical protein